MLVTGGYIREEGGSSVCWALAWAGHHLEGFAFVFYINFLGRVSSSFPLCSLPSFPISAPPCMGWRQEGERDGGFHPSPFFFKDLFLREAQKMHQIGLISSN